MIEWRFSWPIALRRNVEGLRLVEVDLGYSLLALYALAKLLLA